ncbi:MAG: MgtC/SapB family protein [Treponema sp.]|nr:MgtC/SapB family protein [Treponema sp.]
MNYKDCIIRFALILFFSFILGLERKSHQHTVGIRTLVLMGISSCLLSMLSIEMAAAPIVKGDPTRIAAGVITGIGFLGGGAILKQGLNIRGLTTAAIIFTISAIGMACGAGFFIPAAITFIITMVILFTMDKLEKKMFPASKTKTVMLTLNWDSLHPEEIQDIMKFHGMIIHDMTIKYHTEENTAELSYTVKTPDKMNNVQLVEDFKEKISGLKDFKICDK